MPTSSYTFTPDAVSKPLILSASADGLTLIENMKPVLITWSDVMRVQLWFDPTRFNRNRFRCRVSTRSGRTIAIESTSFRGVADFVDQPNEYRSLVEAVHEQVRTQGKNVVFIGGVGGTRYGLNIACLAVAMAALSVALTVAGVSYIGWTAIVHLLVIGFSARLLWKWIARNRPSIFDPRAIPAALLPKAVAVKTVAAMPVAKPAEIAAVAPAPVQIPLPPRRPKPSIDDYAPIAEPGDPSWCSVGGNTTHWADAAKYVEADLKQWEEEERAWAEYEKQRAPQDPKSNRPGT